MTRDPRVYPQPGEILRDPFDNLAQKVSARKAGLRLLQIPLLQCSFFLWAAPRPELFGPRSLCRA
jgi:hypothetical protein